MAEEDDDEREVEDGSDEGASLPATSTPASGPPPATPVATSTAPPGYEPYTPEAPPPGYEPYTPPSALGGVADIPKAFVKAVSGLGAPLFKGGARLAQAAGLTDDATKTGAYKIGQDIERGSQMLADMVPGGGNPDSLIGQITGLATNIAPVMVVGPLEALALGSAQMGLGEAAKQGDQAQAAGADPSATNKAVTQGAGLGAVLGVIFPGVAKVLAPMARTSPGVLDWARSMLKNAALEGVTFAGVNEAQNYLSAQIAKGYDANSQWVFDPKAALAALATGGLIGGYRGYHADIKPGRPDTGAPTAPADKAAVQMPGQSTTSPTIGVAAEALPTLKNPAPNPGSGGDGSSRIYRKGRTQAAAPEAPNSKVLEVGEEIPGVVAPAPREATPAEDEAIARLNLGEQPEDVTAAIKAGQPEPPVENPASGGPAPQPAPAAPAARPGYAPTDRPFIPPEPFQQIPRPPVPKTQPVPQVVGEVPSAQKPKLEHPTGVTVAVENPKGSIREGVDPKTGQPWSVKMPVHYGEIEGTRGADGDKVDAYVVGPHNRADVIDQKDLGTGKFDEHKVMLGSPNRAVSLEAYRRSFSDGKGNERVGGVTPMTGEQLRGWLADRKNTKIPAAQGFKAEGVDSPATREAATKIGPKTKAAMEGAARRREEFAAEKTAKAEAAAEQRAAGDKLALEIASKPEAEKNALFDKLKGIGKEPARPEDVRMEGEPAPKPAPVREEPAKPSEAAPKLAEVNQRTRKTRVQPAETPEQKRQRLANETPEQKAARLKAEEAEDKRLTAAKAAKAAKYKAASEFTGNAKTGAYPITDHTGAQVASARSEVDARNATRALKVAKEIFDKTPPPEDLNLSKEPDRAKLLERIKAVRAEAADNAWTTYNPRPADQSKFPEQMWMREVDAFARKKRLNPEEAAKFVANELQLRGRPEDVAAVREQRRVENDELKQQIDRQNAPKTDEQGEEIQAPEPTEAVTAGAKSEPEEPAEEVKAPKSVDQMTDAEREALAAKYKPTQRPEPVREAQKARASAPAGETLSERIARQKAEAQARKAAGETKPPPKPDAEVAKPFDAADKGAPGEDDIKATETAAKKEADGSFLDGVHKVVDDFINDTRGSGPPLFGHYTDPARKVMRNLMKSLRQIPAARTMGVWADHVIDQHADKFFAGRDANPTRDVSRAKESISVKTREYLAQDADMLAKLAKMDPEAQETFMDEVALGVWGDRDLTRKEQGFDWRGSSEAYVRSAHPKMAERINALSDADFATRNELHEMMQEREKAIAEDVGIKRILKMLDAKDDGLAERIATGKETPADVQAVGGQETLDALQALAKAPGNGSPYLTLARRGAYAVMGHKPLDIPANARRLTDDQGKPVNKFEFNTKAERDAFSTKLEEDGHNIPSDTEYFVDTKGSRLNPETHRHYTKGDAEDDPTLTKRYASDVNVTRLERVGTEREAITRQAELEQEGYKTDYQPVIYRGKNNSELLASELGLSAQRAFRNNPLFAALGPKEKLALKQLVSEMHLDLLGSTRATNRRLRKKGVAGYSTDAARSFQEWSAETAARRARMEFDPQIDAAVDKLTELSKPFSGDPKTSAARQAITNEVKKRIYDLRNGVTSAQESLTGKMVHRMLVASSLTRLDTPRFILQNLTQQPTHTLPYLAADHGLFPAARALYKANKDIGIGTIFKDAAKATKDFATGATPTDVFKLMKGRLKSPEEQRVAQDLFDSGKISYESAQQEENLTRQPLELDIGRGETTPVRDVLRRGAESTLNTLDAGLRWVSDFSRPINSAAEVVNRTGTGLAAFRLERAKGASYDSALHAAEDAINTTQVNYSNASKPEWQRKTLTKIPLQFHHFGFQMAAWMGQDIARVVRNTNKGDRQKGLIRTGGLMASVFLFAGASGMPTEQIVSPVLTALKALGLTDTDWNDIETGVSHATSMALGKAFGLDAMGRPGPAARTIKEVLAHGLPRLLNIDMTGNLGINNLLTFGAPDYARVGSRDYYAHLLDWIAHSAMGSVGGMALDAVKGMNNLIHGDVLQAAQNAPLPRVITDIAKAGEGLYHGKVNARGVQTAPPYTPYQATMKGLGFTPSEDVDRSAVRGAKFQDEKRQQAIVSEKVDAWKNAKTSDAKNAAWRDAIAAGVKPATLTKAMSVANKQQNINGIPVTKNNRAQVQELNNAYNLPSK